MWLVISFCHFFFYQLAISKCFYFGIFFSPNTENVCCRYLQRFEEQVQSMSIITFCVGGRHASFVYPIKTESVPFYLFRIFFCPQLEHLLCCSTSRKSEMESSFRFRNCALQVVCHGSKRTC